MLVASGRTVALRCPLCGRFGLHPFTLFDFSGDRTFKLTCDCGFHKMIITTRDYKEYVLQIPCVICETTHRFTLKKEDLWNSDLQYLRCMDTGSELGFLGHEDAVKVLVAQSRDQADSIVNDDGFDDFFTNPDIMYQILSRLHEISERGDLFCACGQHDIEVEVFPERLELVCPACKSVNIVFAETVEDLQAVLDVPVIGLIENGFSSIDASGFRSRTRKGHLEQVDDRLR